MTWTMLDDGFIFHRKTVAVGNEGAGAFCRMLVWCNKEATDGFVSDEAAALIAPLSVVDSLVRVKLLHRVEGGYRIHDFDVYQPEAATEKARRDAISARRSAAGRLGAAARWSKERDGKDIANANGKDGFANGKSIANGWQTPWQTDGPSPSEISSLSSGSSSPSPASEISEEEIREETFPTGTAPASPAQVSGGVIDGNSPSEPASDPWGLSPTSGVHRVASRPSSPPESSPPPSNETGAGTSVRPSPATTSAPPSGSPPPRGAQAVFALEAVGGGSKPRQKPAKANPRRPVRDDEAPPPAGYQSVIDAYFQAFLAMKGVKPSTEDKLMKRRGKAAKDLLAVMPAPEACECIRRALADQWFWTGDQGGTLWKLAANPEKYRGSTPTIAPRFNGGRPLQPPAPPGQSGWKVGKDDDDSAEAS